MQSIKKQRNKKLSNKKTKTIRISIENAFAIEQTARELAAEMQQEIIVSQIMDELVKELPNAKERVKNKINKASKN